MTLSPKIRKILITGGAGFIGFHLSEKFFNLGYQVIIIDNLSTSVIKSFDAAIKLYRADINNLKTLKKIFQKEKPEIIYYLTGPINLRKEIDDPLFKKTVNFLEQSKIILDCCIKYKVKKTVFISSGGAIYGEAKIIPTPEDYPAHPNSLYGLANLMIEKYITLYHKKYGLDYTIFRVSNAYGPRQWESGVIPSFIINTLKERRPIIFGSGRQTRDFIYISDVIEALILALENKATGEIYNVGSGQEFSLNTILNKVFKITNKRIKPIYRKLLIKDDLQRSVLDIRKIQKELHWKPKISLEQGLEKTLEWFQKEYHYKN